MSVVLAHPIFPSFPRLTTKLKGAEALNIMSMQYRLRNIFNFSHVVREQIVMAEIRF
jgi:hypothetical protein